MGQDPDAIREEIARTRSEMGETVEAIGYKADVPARAREAVTGRVDAAKAKVGEAVGAATPSSGQVKRQARRAAGLAQENPLGLAVGAAAVGFLAGLALPSTRAEDERIGPMADQVRQKAAETGQEALERGRQVAREAAGDAAETARQGAERHGQELAASARQRAEEIT